MRLVDCTPERHAGAILALLNDAIAHSTALYDCHPRPAASMAPWFAAKAAGGFTQADTIAQAGFQFGRWLGLAFYQRTLDTPAHPVDD